jgi:amino acid adenylation domain-containing protein
VNSDLSQRLTHLSPQKKRQLLAQLLKAKTSRHTSPIQPIPRDGPLVVSYAQRRLWFLDQMGLMGNGYHVRLYLRLRGSLQRQALARSLSEIVRRHEALRAGFRSMDGEPFQVVLPPIELEMPVQDLSHLAPGDREAAARRLAAEESARLFDLTRGPLIRAQLIRLDTTEHALLITVHHIAIDGWSISVLARELSVLYEAFVAGKPSPLPPLPVQYSDFAVWQRDRLQGDVLAADLAYWIEHLRHLPELQLPADYPRPAEGTPRGATLCFQIAPEVTVALQDLSRQQGATLFMTLLATFQCLLARYSGQERLAVGSPIAARTHSDIEGLIGFFVNTLVLCTDLSGDPRFTDLLERVRQVTLGAYAHQELPFEKLVEELQPIRDVNQNPLFRVVFALQQQETMTPRFRLPDLEVSQLEADDLTVRFDLEWHVWPEDAGLQGRFIYNADRFTVATIERMAGHVQTLLAGIVADPTQRLSQLPLLTEHERHQVLVVWNATAPEAPPVRCLHHLFETQVERTPEAIAVIGQDTQLTYAELNRQTNQLAHTLLALGVGPEELVGLYMERSVEMVVGLLAILKTGGAYVPLDPAYPKTFLTSMLDDVQVSVLLTQERLTADHPVPDARVVCVDTDRKMIAQQTQKNLHSRTTSSALAGVLYAARRGILLEHRGIEHRLAWLQNTFTLSSADTVWYRAPLMQETAVWELFWPLLVGARVAITGGVDAANPTAWQHVIATHKVTVAHVNPSELVAWLDAMPVPTEAPLKSLRWVLCSGASLSQRAVDAFLRHVTCGLYHVYSVPEAAGVVTAQVCQPGGARQTVPMGQVTNMSVSIRDPYQQPVPVGIPGDVYIGGPGLARGYLRASAETAQRFGGLPFSETPGVRWFKTGEVGRRLSDSTLELSGERGRQTRIAGFRVDRAEVEAALLTEPSVEACVVLARETEMSDPHLVAYVVSAPPFVAVRFHDHMQAIVPDFMRPCAYIPVSTLPLTATGHIDDGALARLPVIDDDLIRQWETRLQSVPGIERVAVVIREQAEALPPPPLSDLCPAWDTTTARDNEKLVSAPGNRDTGSEKTGPKVLAISQGGPLRQADGAPLTLADALQSAAQQSPATAIVYLQSDGSEIIQSYGDLLEEAKRILAGLRTLGLQPQNKVILQCDRNADFIPAFWGCVLGGFVPVPLAVPPTYTQYTNTLNQLQYAWQMLEHPVVLSSARLASAMRASSALLDDTGFRVVTLDDMRTCGPDRGWHNSRPDDLALLLLTSGSTGTPKAVMQTHHSLLSRSAGTVQANHFSQHDVSLNWMPLSHVGGIVMFHLRDVYLRCRQIQVPTDFILQHPLKWLDLIDRHQATITWAPNFAFALVNEHAADISRRRWDLSSMRFILNGGEAIVAKTTRRFLELLRPHGLSPTSMHPAWGMSETCSGVTYSHRFALDTTTDEDAFVEVGTPIPGFSMRIVDTHNRLVEEGTSGRLQVKGAPITPGYYQNPQLNQERFTADGWFHTGDLGFLREGRLTLTGREKEVIIINGINFSSADIEAVVEEIEGVEVSYTAACAVHAQGHDAEQLALFFSPTRAHGLPLIALIKAIRERVVRQIGINPVYIVPVEKETIPKTAIGKIQRAALRQRFETGDFDALLNQIYGHLETIHTLPDWFYRPIWRRKDVMTYPVLDRTGVYLVLLDQQGLGTRLCAELERRHQAVVGVELGADFARLAPHHYRLDPRNAAHYRCLLASLSAEGLRPNHILHLWTYSAPTGEITSLEALDQAQEPGIYSLLFLVQALAEVQGTAPPVRLQVVSSQAQRILPTDELAYEKTPMLGLLHTLPQEMSWLTCRHVDLPSDCAEVNTAHILRELCELQGDREVAYRNGQRWVLRLAKVDFRREKQQELPFKPGAMYLISGGLGGIGVEVAQYLLQHYQARLLLVGRTSLPENRGRTTDAEQDEARRQRLEAYRTLEQLGGEMVYRAVDICDAVRLRQVVTQAKARWGCELDGVIHLAGMFQPRLLTEENRQSLAATLRAKMLGTWVLHHLIKDQPDGVFISFASVNGFFGGATVGAYAAANRFLEGFVHYQQRQSPLRSYCFSWSMWDEIGMSRNYPMKSLSQARGYNIMTAKQGLSSFLVGLHHGHAHLLVGVDGRNPHIQRYLETTSCGVQRLTAYVTTQNHDGSVPRVPDINLPDRFQVRSTCDLVSIPEMPLTPSGEIDHSALLAAQTRQPEHVGAFVTGDSEVEEVLRDIWADLLGQEQISPHDNFFELGGHSLLATRLVSRIAEALQVVFPLSRVFETPTIAGMAHWIGDHRPSGEATPIALPDCLVAIQPHGTKRPFFCVHPGGGSPLCYVELARYLGSDQPFFGFQAPSLVDGRNPLRHVDAIAASYIEAMRRVQPTGPYLIGGWSFGGLVACDMARQLEAQGERVALVALLDGGVVELKRRTGLQTLRNLLGILAETCLSIFHIKPPTSYRELRLLANSLGVSLPARRDGLHIRGLMLEIGRSIRLLTCNTLAMIRYTPRRYGGKVTLFRTRSYVIKHDPLLNGLRRFATEVEQFPVPGNHMTLLQDERHIRAVAEQLQACLMRVHTS